MILDQCLAQLPSEKLPPAAVGKKTMSHNQTTCREWETFEHSALDMCLYQNPSIRAQETVEEEVGKE